MSSSCPETEPLAPAPQVPAAAKRQVGINVFSDEEGTCVEVVQGITAGELGLNLALLVPAGARLDRGTTFRFLPANPLPQ